MAITQVISPIPAAGHRGVDNQTTFVQKQEIFQDTLTSITVGELNNLVSQINTSSSNMATLDSNTTTNATSAAADALAASASANAAHNSELSAIAALEAFNDKYLGAFTSAPTLDNQGDPLITGATYYNSVSQLMFVYDAVLHQWIQSSYVPTDHGQLSGLADDDHTQYHNNTRGDTRYYTKAQAQELLVSGTNIKTVSGQSLLGTGNIEFSLGTKITDLYYQVPFSISDIKAASGIKMHYLGTNSGTTAILVVYITTNSNIAVARVVTVTSLGVVTLLPAVALTGWSSTAFIDLSLYSDVTFTIDSNRIFIVSKRATNDFQASVVDVTDYNNLLVSSTPFIDTGANFYNKNINLIQTGTSFCLIAGNEAIGLTFSGTVITSGTLVTLAAAIVSVTKNVIASNVIDIQFSTSVTQLHCSDSRVITTSATTAITGSTYGSHWHNSNTLLIVSSTTGTAQYINKIVFQQTNTIAAPIVTTTTIANTTASTGATLFQASDTNLYCVVTQGTSNKFTIYNTSAGTIGTISTIDVFSGFSYSDAITPIINITGYTYSKSVLGKYVVLNADGTVLELTIASNGTPSCTRRIAQFDTSPVKYGNDTSSKYRYIVGTQGGTTGNYLYGCLVTDLTFEQVYPYCITTPVAKTNNEIIIKLMNGTINNSSYIGKKLYWDTSISEVYDDNAYSGTVVFGNIIIDGIPTINNKFILVPKV